jgi:SAM-dependent methyltransferase
MNKLLPKFPFLNRIAVKLRSRKAGKFPGSEAYWEQRYRKGGNSGLGSYGKHARFKSQIINGFILEHDITSVIEFGCGDGNQLKPAKYPRYTGFDVSESAVALCREQFSTDPAKEFRLMKDYRGEKADVALSLDVVYHLVEDSVFEKYMAVLFAASDRYVIIYSSNSDTQHGYESPHVKHRKFTDWISIHAPRWKLAEHHEGDSADFYIYEKN